MTDSNILWAVFWAASGAFGVCIAEGFGKPAFMFAAGIFFGATLAAKRLRREARQ